MLFGTKSRAVTENAHKEIWIFSLVLKGEIKNSHVIQNKLGWERKRDVGKETKASLFRRRKTVECLRNKQQKFCTVSIKSAEDFMNTVIQNKTIKTEYFLI